VGLGPETEEKAEYRVDSDKHP